MSGIYTGNVLTSKSCWTALDAGRGHISLHKNVALDFVPEAGGKVSIKYHHGQGKVEPPGHRTQNLLER